jgi:hypothetical protein
MHARADLAHCVPAFDRPVGSHRLLLVQGAGHLPERDLDRSGGRIIGSDVARVEDLVATGPRREVVEERHLELVRGSKREIVRLVDRPRSVRVDQPLRRQLIAVR